MADVKEDKKVQKIKKKKWYTILAPKLINEAYLGETSVTDSELVMGKTLSINLMSLLNDVKKQNINVKFKVYKIDGDRALTDIVGYEIVLSSLKRMVRKGKKRVDMSFVCITKDKKKVRIKPLLLITTKTKGSTESNLRKETLEFVARAVKNSSYDDILHGLISHKLQEALRAHLKRIYPLRVCEIRQIILLKEDSQEKPVEVGPEKVYPKEEEGEFKEEKPQQSQADQEQEAKKEPQEQESEE